MAEAPSQSHPQNGGSSRSARGLWRTAARLTVAASAMAFLLLAAWSNSAAATNPVGTGPISGATFADPGSKLPDLPSLATKAVSPAPADQQAEPTASDAPLSRVVDEYALRSTPTPAPTAVPAFGGRNRFAIPSLGINSSIGNTSCGALIPNGIWRWPCAGRNNLYLMGHAWGVFAPLNKGYHAGALRPGLIALYADGAGVVHTYKLQWVQDLPVAVWGQGATWAATPGPVITLQTCDGATSDYRIMVRFVPD